MVIAIIGESCTGKTTIAMELKKHTDFTLYNGKDYLKLAKNESNARIEFRKILSTISTNLIVYLITDKEDLDVLPEEVKKVLITTDIETIKIRFKQRMHNNLPKPVEMMLERKHGMFDNISYDLHLSSDNLQENVTSILNLL